MVAVSRILFAGFAFGCQCFSLYPPSSGRRSSKSLEDGTNFRHSSESDSMRNSRVTSLIRRPTSTLLAKKSGANPSPDNPGDKGFNRKSNRLSIILPPSPFANTVDVASMMSGREAHQKINSIASLVAAFTGGPLPPLFLDSITNDCKARGSDEAPPLIQAFAQQLPQGQPLWVLTGSLLIAQLEWLSAVMAHLTTLRDTDGINGQLSNIGKAQERLDTVSQLAKQALTKLNQGNGTKHDVNILNYAFLKIGAPAEEMVADIKNQLIDPFQTPKITRYDQLIPTIVSIKADMRCSFQILFIDLVLAFLDTQSNAPVSNDIVEWTRQLQLNPDDVWSASADSIQNQAIPMEYVLNTLYCLKAIKQSSLESSDIQTLRTTLESLAEKLVHLFEDVKTLRLETLTSEDSRSFQDCQQVIRLTAEVFIEDWLGFNKVIYQLAADHHIEPHQPGVLSDSNVSLQDSIPTILQMAKLIEQESKASSDVSKRLKSSADVHINANIRHLLSDCKEGQGITERYFIDMLDAYLLNLYQKPDLSIQQIIDDIAATDHQTSLWKQLSSTTKKQAISGFSVIKHVEKAIAKMPNSEEGETIFINDLHLLKQCLSRLFSQMRSEIDFIKATVAQQPSEHHPNEMITNELKHSMQKTHDIIVNDWALIMRAITHLQTLLKGM